MRIPREKILGSDAELRSWGQGYGVGMVHYGPNPDYEPAQARIIEIDQQIAVLD